MGKAPECSWRAAGFPFGGGLVLTTPTPGMRGLRVGLGTEEQGGCPEPVLGVRGRPEGAGEEDQAVLAPGRA